MVPAGTTRSKVRVSMIRPRCPFLRRPSSTLPEVETLLIAGSSVAGLVIGAALDPIGQQLADRSRAADDRRRDEERAEERAAHQHAETAGRSDIGDAEPVAGQPGAADAPPSGDDTRSCLLYTSPSPRDGLLSRM